MKIRHRYTFLDKCKESEDRFKKFDLDYYDTIRLKTLSDFFRKNRKNGR